MCGHKGRMRRMIRGECPECDEAVPLLASRCRHCGAPHPTRRNVIAAAAGIMVLVGASAGAVVIATRHPQPVSGAPQVQAPNQPQQPAVGQPQPSAAGQQPASGAPPQQEQVGQATSVMPAAAISERQLLLALRRHDGMRYACIGTAAQAAFPRHPTPGQ